MNLGWFELCLNVRDLARALSFYEKLGFRRAAGSLDEGAVIIQNDDCRIGLYQGHIGETLLNFRGGDVSAIAQSLQAKGLTFDKDPFPGADGSMAALLRDPDGNALYFVSHPGERRKNPL